MRSMFSFLGIVETIAKSHSLFSKLLSTAILLVTSIVKDTISFFLIKSDKK